MKIVALTYDNGPSYHRLTLPLSLMEGVEVKFMEMRLNLIMDQWAEEDAFESCDMVIYSRVLEGYVLKWVNEKRKQYGFKVCVDVDDYWEIGQDHILYDKKRDTFLQLVQIGHLQYADVVTTTHERLAAEISPHNSNVHILPNAIPKTGQFVIEREPCDQVRLFWQGSRTHRRDLEILEKPIMDLAKLFGKIKMVIGGVETSDELFPVWKEMIDIYTAGRRHMNAYIQGEPPINYYAMYRLADVCLVPLIRNSFNRFKSNLKVLEAANLGLPVIASQVHPYLSMPIRYCLRGSDWVEHIKYLVKNPKAREDDGNVLKEWADVNFNFNKINEERKQVLESTIKQTHEPAK